MSRSGYTDDCENLQLWRGAVSRAINGKRGQAALRELAAAMDAMPVKKLAAESLITAEGEFCTLGVLGNARGLEIQGVDPDDWDAVSAKFGLAPAMVREIVYENDEVLHSWDYKEVEICGPVRPHYPEYGSHAVTIHEPIPEDLLAQKRWQHMRNWVDAQLRPQVITD